MDPADTQRALSIQDAGIGRHKQSFQFTHEILATLACLLDALVQHLDPISSRGAAGNSDGGGAAATPDAYACDPEPDDADLSKCRGFVLQSRLVFSQRARLFHSDQAKINYIVFLLRGKPWLGTRLVQVPILTSSHSTPLVLVLSVFLTTRIMRVGPGIDCPLSGSTDREYGQWPTTLWTLAPWLWRVAGTSHPCCALSNGD